MCCTTSNSTIRINRTVNTVVPIFIFLHKFKPSVVTLSKLCDTLVNQQVLKDLRCQRDTHSRLQGVFINLRGTSRCNLSRLPTSFHKHLSNVTTGIRVKGNLLILRIRNTCFNSFLSVISLVDLVSLVDSPRAYLRDKALINLLSLCREFSIELYCRIFIKDKPITFLLSHDPSNVMLKLNGLQRVTLSHQLMEQLKGNHNVLLVVLIHLRSEFVPCVLLFTIGALQFTHTITISLQAVGTIEGLREPTRTNEANVSVLNVRIDQTSKYKSVNTDISNIKCKPLPLELLKSRDVEFADIVTNDAVPTSTILIQGIEELIKISVASVQISVGVIQPTTPKPLGRIKQPISFNIEYNIFVFNCQHFLFLK